MAKVLVVEDERSMADSIRYSLAREGHDVLLAADGETAIRTVRSAKPDLILLDVMLPGVSGFDVCRTVRPETTAPILMLTARGEEMDRVVGLEIGADDYIAKPFSMRELMARIRASLRRTSMLRSADAEIGDERIVSGDLVIDLGRHEVTLAGAQVSLKPKEFELLAGLVRNAGRVLTRDVLLQRIWGYEYDGGTRTVDVHVRGLREKIEQDPSNPVRLETVRGVGYRFRA
jgi:two-component system OmpR family response regulator